MALTLTGILTNVDEDTLVRVSAENPGWKFEIEEDGTLLVSPTHTNGGAHSAEACGQLRDWKLRAGGRVFDSNADFKIGPGKRVYSPDAAWLSSERIASLTPEERTKFWAVSPDVIIEVNSASDDWSDTLEKTRTYIERGTIFAVAIDPATREVAEFGAKPDGLELDYGAVFDA